MIKNELSERILTELEWLDDIAPSYGSLEYIAKKLGAELHNGATRWAFVFKKHRIVFKFPRFNRTDLDYCEIELNNYNIAKEYRVERALLPLEFMGKTSCGLPIYCQPMYTKSYGDTHYKEIHILERKMGRLTRSSTIDKIQEGMYSSPSRIWTARATQIYGKAFMKSFEAWSHRCEVNDLHSGNIGWLGKMPIIIDYAGYRNE